VKSEVDLNHSDEEAATTLEQSTDPEKLIHEIKEMNKKDN